ncbi:MAG: class I SAM-dependent methyltransferase [Myxococcota bacterium]|nr:class I SAM-dependent methyltransferase [Myxococcota bacterium]MDW8361087.1 class I SAM-dependent methyltransferase [Myxococcales bacterium]
MTEADAQEDAQEERARRYYDAFAASYERCRHHGYHALVDQMQWEALRPLVAGRDVLEVGCGTGLLLRRAAEVARTARGVDLSPGMLAHALRRGLDVRVASATALPFDDASFDVVYAFKVLAHVPDVGVALAQMARVCRDGGAVLFDVYNPWSLRWLARRVAGPRPISHQHTEQDVPTRWDPPTRIARWLAPGLRIRRVEGIRVLTPAAALHRFALVAPWLARAERRAARGPLRWFGGFLLVHCERTARGS